MHKVVAIHQPNFFPWLGYFDKILHCDVFILLDDVQFPKTGGSWSNRVKVLVGGQAKWMTAPINRAYSGTRNIDEMEFIRGNWREKSLRTLRQNYQCAPCFDECMSVVEPLLLDPENNLSAYNANAVERISECFGVENGKFVLSSALRGKGSANELLISLTKLVGGDTYMCGGGASGYQDDDLFHKEGVTLKYQDFKNPVYPQASGTSFIGGLSVIDAAMNLGWDGVRKLLVATRC